MPDRAHEAHLDDDLDGERRYLSRAQRLLGDMTVRTSGALADAAERAAGDWDATVAQAHLHRRMTSLADDEGPLCFGRIDEEAGPSWHIGRRHVEDRSGEAVVVDWRAPVAVPFYRATAPDPCGLRRRRRLLFDDRALVDLLDEDFAHPGSVEALASAGLPDPLLAQLGRARTGVMRDIVATIAGEQDRVIRAPLDQPVVVQGGPGTGKTAVGLHRAAYLLYEHRALLERQGVLVLGPNRIFLAYVAQVLPSLGEVAVRQTTLAGLVGQWRVRGEGHPRVAALKGDPRLWEVLERAAEGSVRAPSRELRPSTRWGSVTLSVATIAALQETALSSGGPLAQRRRRFHDALRRVVVRELGERRGKAFDSEEVARDLAADRPFQAALQRLWPTRSAPTLVRELLGRPATMAAAGRDVLTPDERVLLHRPPRRSVADERWTDGDLPLLDAAEALLSGPPLQRYGHIVVDEAQDLSMMALRMVARRSIDGRSFTVLGDLAQATAPAAPHRWHDALRALGDPPGARVEELTVGYRVPEEIMDMANRLLPTLSPQLVPTRSVRSTGEPPRVRGVGDGDLAAAVVTDAGALRSEHGTVGVIAAPAHLEAVLAGLRQAPLPVDPPGRAPVAGHVALVRPWDAKGLEFDAVVVVEPSELASLPGGTGLLFIALTRAVRHLTILHARPLPAPLQADGA